MCTELVRRLVHRGAVPSGQRVHQQDGPGEAQLQGARLHAHGVRQAAADAHAPRGHRQRLRLRPPDAPPGNVCGTIPLLTPSPKVSIRAYASLSRQANNRLAKRGGRTMAITPRHYLDFINHYANLFNEKRSELEEQQMHLNVGLRKIKETVDQVS